MYTTYAPRRPHSRAASPQPAPGTAPSYPTPLPSISGYPSPSPIISPPYPSSAPYQSGYPTYPAPVPSAPIPAPDSMIHSMNHMSLGPGYATSNPPMTPREVGKSLRRSKSQAEFRVEAVPRSTSSMGMRGYNPANTGGDNYYDEGVYRQRVAALLAAKDRSAFVSTGYVFVDPAQIVLFFRSKSGVAQSIDFPIDVDYNSPPALDVLIAACRPHQTSNYNNYAERESMFYPPSLPLTTSFEISNFPILDSVKNSLFPRLPAGHYLTAIKDKFEVLLDGVRLERQTAHQRNDGRAATVLLTLPVRFAGGAVIVRDPITGIQERFIAKAHPAPPSAGGGPKESLEWIAFHGNCDYETEIVEKGYRVMLSYGIYIKNFSPEGAVRFDSLAIPTDYVFDLLAPLMNMSRGKKIGFYLSHDYNVDPSQVNSQMLIPELKGSDYTLYHAFKMYKLNPELHWAAGEYIWPADRLVEFFSEDIEGSSPLMSAGHMRNQVPYPPPRPGSVHGMYSGYPQPNPNEQDPLRAKVEDSGGQTFADAGITVLSPEWINNTPTDVPHGAVERVPFIAHGELKKFVVNVMLVVFVP
ncbi:hypothetical protein BKA70DRAFT_1433808 [Coprinopsis sp. MPI-PUGE-AT-0042]|nr:hypothetical protein BKA70DRAFT_1433808 [Coprinopsis sp. MPI-PUGE-AT-0042]